MKLASLNPFLVTQLLAATSFFAMSVGAHAATNTWLGTTNSNWDTTTNNWTSPTAWTNGNDAIFNSTGAGIVQVAAGGVTAHNLTFNNNGYTIQGGGLTLVTAAATIDTATGVSATISSVIGGSVGLAKTGTGTLTLTKTNTYTGMTTVDAGTLVFSPTSNSASTLTIISGSATINDGGVLKVDFTNVKNGTTYPLVILNGGGGSTTINAGGTLELYADATHAMSNTAVLFASGGATLSGAGTLKKTGAGAVDFWSAGPGTGFTGMINVDDGVLTFQQGSTAFSGKSALFINTNGTVDIRSGGDHTLLVDALSGTGVIGVSDGGTKTLSVGNNGGTGSFSGQILSSVTGRNGVNGTWGASTLNLTKNGAGTQTLSGANTYTGVTKISAGKLSVATINNGGVAGNLGAATNAAANLVLDGGTLQYTGDTASTNRAFTITAAKTGTIEITNASTNLTISGASALTTGALTKTGAGMLTLSGTNLHTGATTVSAGTLNVTGSLTSDVTVNSGATLRGTGTTTGTIDLLSGSAIFGGATGSSFQGSSVTTHGANSVTVLGNNNTAAGTFTMGVLRHTAGSPTLGDFDTSGYRSATISDTGTEVRLQYTAEARIWNQTSGSWATNTTGWSGGDTNYFQGDVVTFGNNGTGARTVTLNSQVTPGAVTFNNDATHAYTVSGTGGITGSTGLTKNGVGTVTLTTANTYTGATAVNSGTLQLGDGTVGNDGTLSATSAVTVGGTGTLAYNIAGNQTISYGITGTTTATLVKDGAGTLTLNNTGAVNFGSDGSSLQVKNGRLIYTNLATTTGLYQKSIDISSGATLEMNVASGVSNNFGGWDGTYTGTGTLVKSGAGTLSFGQYGGSRSANFSSGALIWIQNGTLIGHVGSGQSVSWNNNQASLRVDSGATFSSGGQAIRVDSLDGSGSVLGGGSLTVGVAGGSNTFSGVISGAGTFTKIGAGTQILSGANIYTGLTTVSAGELHLNKTAGQSIAGDLTVSGGTAKLLQANQINNTKSLVVSGGTFDIQGNNQTLANVQLTSGSINGSGGTLTSTNAYDMRAGTVSAKLGGGVALNKTTGGTLTLSGANTYTGATTITGGTLALTGTGSIDNSSGVSLGTVGTFDVSGRTGGAYMVNNLSGSGTVIGALTVSSTLAIGNSPGAVTFNGDLTLAGTTTTMELAGLGGVAGTDSDFANVTGTLTVDGTLAIISYGGYDTTQIATYNLFDSNGAVLGDYDAVTVAGNALTFASNVWSGSFGGKTYNFSENTGVLTVVPEPATALLGCLGMLVLLRRRRA